MNQVAAEECPICWRSYSSTLVPVTIVCGHTFCPQCSTDLRKCPLCRRRLQNGYTAVTNYSLLSLVNRMEQAGKKETKDQEVQTEKITRAVPPRTGLGSVVDKSPGALALDVIVKLSRVQQVLARSFTLNSNRRPN
jgi:hypothetical protein